MLLSSHADDGAIKATWAMARCRYLVMLAMMPPSLADDGTIEATLAVL
jgi:hypothetical protein